MRRLQLEYGAEIGRAVVNFDGPIVFCVDLALPRRRVRRLLAAAQRQPRDVALEGAHASVIGGAPAAAVVFARDVEQRARATTRGSRALDERIAAAEGAERQRLRAERERALGATCCSEKRGEFAAEFDAIHSVERAVEVGSVDRIIAAAELRPH